MSELQSHPSPDQWDHWEEWTGGAPAWSGSISTRRGGGGCAAGRGSGTSTPPTRTRRVWWSDAGVHQNLTFPPQPDPVSGMHCWLQRVRVAPARPDDQAIDVAIDTASPSRCTGAGSP